MSLVSPSQGATVDNGRTDIYDGIEWNFDWSDCPGATRYHLYVTGPGAAYPIIDQDMIPGSSYHHVSRGYIMDKNRLGWMWKVRANVDGRWSEWSKIRTFDAEPVNSDPQPPSNPQVCTVALQSPKAGALLDNGRTDGEDSIEWDFDWSDCRGATQYHLYVIGPGAKNPVIDVDTGATSAYHTVGLGEYIVNNNRFGWTWKVRACVNGQWGEWSEVWVFDVEPVDADPPS